jgi:transposase-like protein
MISEHRTCCECQSNNIVKNGKNKSGSQTYKCKDCGCYRVLDSKQPSRRLDMEAVERTYEERQSLRGTARMFNVSDFFIRTAFKNKPVH